MSQTFDVPGIPVGKQRHRMVTRGKKPRSYTPPKTVKYETRVAKAAMVGKVRQHAGPIALDVVAVWPYLAKERALVRQEGHLVLKPTKPDGDNVLKAVADALEGIAYQGDGQVALGRVMTLWGPEAVTHVRVTALDQEAPPTYPQPWWGPEPTMSNDERMVMLERLRSWIEGEECEAVTSGRTNGREGMACPNQAVTVREGRFVCGHHRKAQAVEWGE